MKNCTDEFYDLIINKVLFPTKGIFYRRRQENDQPWRIVKQSTWNLTQNCHVYYEEDGSLDGLECFLTVHYTRRYSMKYGVENPNIYLDTVKINHLGLDYAVVTYRLEANLENIKDKILELFTAVHDLHLDTNELTEDKCNELLEDETIPLFPMYSKFMYVLQMSPYFESYLNTYSFYDPIKNPLQIRLIIATSFDNLSTASYDKKWIWLVQYQISYFRMRLGNSHDKFASLDNVLQSIESDRKKIFGDKPINLVVDDSNLF